MTGQAGNTTTTPNELDEATLHSVSGGFMTAPDGPPPGTELLPDLLPNFEVPPEIFDIPEITPPEVTQPNFDDMFNQMFQMIFQIMQQFPPQQAPPAPPQDSGVPEGTAGFGTPISVDYQDQAFLSNQAERLQALDLNQVNLTGEQQDEFWLLNSAINDFYRTTDPEDLQTNESYRQFVGSLHDRLTALVGEIGGQGQDHIAGTDSRNDTLRGFEGNDTLVGGGGADRIGGGAGSDLLYGDWQDDRPGGGADTMDGGVGDGAADIAHGGSGDDTYIWRIGDGNDQFHGGPGNDSLLIGGVGPNQLINNLFLEGAWLHSTDDRIFFFVDAQGQRLHDVSGSLQIGNEILTFTGVDRIELP